MDENYLILYIAYHVAGSVFAGINLKIIVYIVAMIKTIS